MSRQSAGMLWWAWLGVALLSAWTDASASEPRPEGAVVVARYVADGRGPRIEAGVSQWVRGARVVTLDVRWADGGWELVRRAAGRSQCVAERIRLVHSGAELVAWPGRSEVTVCEGRACGLCDPRGDGCACLRPVEAVGAPACLSRRTMPTGPGAFAGLLDGEVADAGHPAFATPAP